jgi:diguanylate cyclase (GGDEF)-like protein
MARLIKPLLLTVMIAFIAAAAYISALVIERQQALEKVSRYNIAWLASQAATEYARLEQRVSAFAAGDRGVDADEVALRFDIIVNRKNLLVTGEVHEFVESDPENKATVEELDRLIQAAQPLVDRIEEPGKARELSKLLATLDSRILRFAAAANRWGGDRVTDDQRQLVSLHWQFSTVAAGLFLCGLILMTVLFWSNRLLRRAHVDLHGLAQQLGTQNERFNAALTNMSQALCMVDSEQRLIVCNQRFLELFELPADGVGPGWAMPGLSPHTSESLPQSTVLRHVIAEQRPLIEGGKSATYLQELADGRTLAVTHQPTKEAGWVATYEDVTERRRVEQRIAYMAHHDALTDLPNRTLLAERIEHAFARAHRFGDEFAVLYLDLDRFKGVNDTLGHPVGDSLLKAVADRLRACTRDTDLVARMGGDEFAVLQIGLEASRSADQLARRIREVVSAPYEIDGNKLIIGTSIGIAVAPSDGVSVDQLLKNADLALYCAKADGRNTHRFFEVRMDEELQARRLIELDLRKALTAGELEVYYQPLVALSDGAITGYEALLRWKHPERGFISPAEFIPIAEEIGLIVPIGEWVLHQACAEASTWEENLTVAVNLSPVQLKSRELVQVVILALANSGLAATRLELEITESVFLNDNEQTLSILHDLRSFGVRIAMDDFGTGYSSLSYLRSFPFDKIKLDRSFVRDLGVKPDSFAIVQSIATLGGTLGMTTTAEGIETAEQLDELKAAGFDQGQGYLFGRPQPAHHIVKPERKIASRAA